MILVRTLVITNYLPMLFLHFPIAIYFYFCDDHNILFWELTYYIYSLRVTYLLLTSYNYYHVAHGLARGGLSSRLLIFIFILYIIYEKRNKIMPLRIVFVFFIVCFASNARAGIISAVLLLVGYWFIYMQKEKKLNNNNYKVQIQKVFMIMLFLIISMYVYLNFEDIFDKYLYRFSSSSKNDVASTESRFFIWNLYLLSLSNLENLILGNNTYILLPKVYDGNLHNSFLMTHACLGIIAFYYMCVFSFRSVMKALKAKNYGLFLLFITFLLRAATDRIFPAKTGDIPMFIMIFYSSYDFLKDTFLLPLNFHEI